MSRAIKLSKTDLAYLKFGGAAGYRNRLENMRIKHEPLSVNSIQGLPFDIDAQTIFVGQEYSRSFTTEQISTLAVLKEAAGQVGYKIESSPNSRGQDSLARILLKCEQAMTFEDIFCKPQRARELVYLKKGSKA